MTEPRTKPPLSQPSDHARWDRDREIEAALRGDNVRIKMAKHALWDNRWAVVLGGALYAVLVWILMSISSKQDAHGAQLMALSRGQAEQEANSKILEVKVNANIETLKTKLDDSIRRTNERIDRLESRK